jgi:hypothetical protein
MATILSRLQISNVRFHTYRTQENHGVAIVVHVSQAHGILAAGDVKLFATLMVFALYSGLFGCSDCLSVVFLRGFRVARFP